MNSLHTLSDDALAAAVRQLGRDESPGRWARERLSALQAEQRRRLRHRRGKEAA